MGEPTTKPAEATPAGANPAAGADAATKKPTIYVLAGHDHNGVFSTAIDEYTKSGFTIIRAKPNESFADAVKAIKPPAHIIMACHGGEDGTFTWNKEGKDSDLTYLKAFYQLQKIPGAKDSIYSVTMESCYGGSAQSMLGSLTPGAIFHSQSSGKVPTYKMSIDKFAAEIGATPDRAKLLLESLDSIDPRTTAELQDRPQILPLPMLFLQNLFEMREHILPEPDKLRDRFFPKPKPKEEPLIPLTDWRMPNLQPDPFRVDPLLPRENPLLPERRNPLDNILLPQNRNPLLLPENNPLQQLLNPMPLPLRPPPELNNTKPTTLPITPDEPRVIINPPERPRIILRPLDPTIEPRVIINPPDKPTTLPFNPIDLTRWEENNRWNRWDVQDPFNLRQPLPDVLPQTPPLKPEQIFVLPAALPEKKHDPKDVLPPVIGIGGMPPTIINLDTEVGKLQASQKANPEAYTRAVAMVRDSFNVLPYTVEGKAKAAIEKEIEALQEPPEKQPDRFEARAAAIRKTEWGKSLKTVKTNYLDISELIEKEVKRRIGEADKVLKTKVDVVAEKIKRGEPCAVEPDGNPDFDELRIRRGIAMANLETTGQLDRMVAEAKTRTQHTVEFMQAGRDAVQRLSGGYIPIPTAMDDLLTTYGVTRENRLPVIDPVKTPEPQPLVLPTTGPTVVQSRDMKEVKR